MREKPCFYKYTCGYDFCQGQDCPEYRAKKQGEKFLGKETTERNDKE